VNGIAEGTYDVVATLRPDADTLHTRMLIDRQHAIETDTVIDLDFTANGVDMADYSIDAPGAEDVSVSFFSTLGTRHAVGNHLDDYSAPPASFFEDEDVMEITANADNADGVLVQTTYRTSEPKNVDLALPDYFDGVVVSAPQTEPYVRLRFAFEPTAAADGYIFQTQGGGSVVGAIVSGGWLDGADTHEFPPDLTDLEGWDNAWSVGEGTDADWTAVAFGANGDAGIADMLKLYPFARPTPAWDGMTFDQSAMTGTLVP
jgi:hypothetical protein